MEHVKGPDIPQTFCRMVDEHQTALLRMCCIYLKDRSLAEDAVQETFLKAYKALPTFRGQSSEKTWLMRIAINTCHDMKRTGWFRHIDRRITPELLPEPVDEASADAVSAAEVVEQIMLLPPKLQEVVLLYYYQSMTVYEIGEALGINHSSVSNRLKRAKEKLRSAMKGAYFNE